MVWSGMVTAGARGTTLKTALSESEAFEGSVAVKVIVSAPAQPTSGQVMVATRSVMLTVRSVFPAYAQAISASVLSTSITYSSRLIVAKLSPSPISWSGISITMGGSFTASRSA